MTLGFFAIAQSLFKIEWCYLLDAIATNKRRTTGAAIRKEQLVWNSDLFSESVKQKAKVGVAVKDDVRPQATNLLGQLHSIIGATTFPACAELRRAAQSCAASPIRRRMTAR